MIRLENVSKIFGTGVAGLSEITLFINKGEFVFLVGHTGSGKTTLLRLLVRDLLPTNGTIIVSDLDIVKLPSNKIPHLRKKVGFIFQDLKLLMDRTILENIALPMQVVGIKLEEGIKRADELLQMVGLTEHRDKFPIQLSGGELQRVAIARALALSPEILLADEPTGNLDPTTALEIVQLLEKINAMGTTVVMATHNIDIVNKLKKRVVGLDRGKLVKDERHEKGTSASAKATADKKESKVQKESKVSKEDSHVIASEGTHRMVHPEAKQSSSEKIASSTPSPRNDDKVGEHKKETKRLSDLLAKARLTLHPRQSSAEKKDDLPFGFEKDADVKEL